MQYEAVLLELMTRIKTLEGEVERLKEEVRDLRSPAEALAAGERMAQEEIGGGRQDDGAYVKMTDRMIDSCYAYGKRAFESRETDIWDLASKVSAETGMNRNSAFMYLHAVKSMLEGTVYKRAINAKATRRYFSNIRAEYGEAGLARALQAVELHIAYRKELHHPVGSIEAICREFKTTR